MNFLLCFALILGGILSVTNAQTRSDTANLPRSYRGPRKVSGVLARPLAPGIVHHKATMSYLRKTSDNKWDVGIPLAIWHAYAKKNNIKDEDEQPQSLPNAAGYVKMQPEPSADIPGGGNSSERVIAVTTAAAETVSKTPGKALDGKSPMKSYTTPEIMLEIGDAPESAVQYHRKTFPTEKAARAYINSIVGGDREFGEIPQVHESDPEQQQEEEEAQQQQGKKGVENAVKLGGGSEAAKEVAAEEEKENANAKPEQQAPAAEPEAPAKEEAPIKGWKSL